MNGFKHILLLGLILNFMVVPTAASIAQDTSVTMSKDCHQQMDQMASKQLMKSGKTCEACPVGCPMMMVAEVRTVMFINDLFTAIDFQSNFQDQGPYNAALEPVSPPPKLVVI